jgi:hypothetical protein
MNQNPVNLLPPPQTQNLNLQIHPPLQMFKAQLFAHFIIPSKLKVLIVIA